MNILKKISIIYILESIMDQQIREEKQQFLRDNILDANYDPNQFMDYCQEEHGGIDIDNWSLEQLKKIVYKYINFKKTKDQQEIKYYKNAQDSNFNQFTSVNSPKKQHVNPSISDQFNQWGNFISAQKVQTKPQSSFQLNLLDLDFLENIQGKKQQNEPPHLNSIHQSHNQQAKSLSVPSDIAKKLQQGKSPLIVGYNPVQLQGHSVQNSTHKKPQSNIKVNEIGNISGNLNKPTGNTSISPPTLQKPNMEKRQSKQQFSIRLETKKVVNRSKLTGKQQVNVTGHQIINPNIFVPKYVLYWITTNPLNVQVKRRLKDFQTLRQLLRKFFPTTQIPHLEKCSRLNQTQPAIIQKQILFLQSFMNSILMNKQLRCKLVQQFLLCPDLDLLKKFMKEYQKLARPRSIQGLFTTQGSVQLKLSNKSCNFLEDQSSLQDFMEDHFTKTKNLYDDLIISMQETSKKLHEIQDLNLTFFNKIKGFNTKYSPDYQCLELEKVLDKVQYLHKQWSQSFKTQSKIIKSEIRHLYRYEGENVKTLKDLLKVQNDIRDSYNKRGEREVSTKEQYTSTKLNQYKLNIEVPSKHMTVLKYQTAYYQQHCSQQCLRFMQQIADKLDKKFKLFCQLQLSIGHDMEGCWRQFEKFYQ